MKVIYLTIAYKKGQGNLYNDLVDCMLTRGHDVTIVCSQPDAESDTLEVINDKYKILQIKTADPFNANLIKKGINTLLLEPKFKRAIKKYFSNDSFDLVLYATPPISLNAAIVFCKKRYHARSYLMLKDIFPQNAVDINLMKKDGLLYKMFRKKEKKLYNISDYIGCMSDGNIKYLKTHNPELAEHKIGLFPNSIRIRRDIIQRNVSKEGPLKIFYGGNLGKPQNIKGLIEIAKLLSDVDVQFVFIGKGTEQHYLEKYVQENSNTNIEFIEYLPVNLYEEKLKEADLGLISLDERFTIPNVPSRMQSYMHLCLPIIAFTDENTDVKDIIKNANCGWWCSASDKDEIHKQVRYISEHRDELKDKGHNGYQYLKENYDVETNVDRLEKFMKGV